MGQVLFGRPRVSRTKAGPHSPGSIVFTDEALANFVGAGFSFSSDGKGVNVNTNPEQTGLHLQWRAYMLDDLRFEASKAVGAPHAERFTFRRAFVKFVCRYSWGAVAMATRRCLFNEIEFTIPRVEGILRFWEALDTLKYIDVYQRPISLAELISFHFQGAVAMWVDQPSGNLRTDLQTAIDQMRHAPAEEIHRRLIKRLRDYVDIDKDLKNREWLKSPGVIEAALQEERQVGQEWYDDLTSGQMSAHGGFLSLLQRNHGPVVE